MTPNVLVRSQRLKRPMLGHFGSYIGTGDLNFIPAGDTFVLFGRSRIQYEKVTPLAVNWNRQHPDSVNTTWYIETEGRKIRT
jgi:hypothetical protein